MAKSKKETAKRYPYLDGYEFVGCMVRSKDILGFIAQDFQNPDPLEQRPTAVFFFYTDKPPERQWAYIQPGEATGISACAVMQPAERWVFVMDDGAVFVSGGGTIGYEDAISKKPHSYFDRVKQLPDGRACAVGANRKAYVRNDVSDWECLADGLAAEAEKTKLDERGFNDISGYSICELYACGDKGDLWQYDGESWTQRTVPTKADLDRILCASDEQVYILTSAREIIIGRDKAWKLLSQDVTNEYLENIVEYNGRILVSTESAIYEVASEGLVEANLGEPILSSKSHIAASDGLLLVAGMQDAAYYDGKEWHMILEPLGEAD